MLGAVYEFSLLAIPFVSCFREIAFHFRNTLISLGQEFIVPSLGENGQIVLENT